VEEGGLEAEAGMRWWGPGACQWCGEATTGRPDSRGGRRGTATPAWGDRLDGGARRRRGWNMLAVGAQPGTRTACGGQRGGGAMARRHAQWWRGVRAANVGCRRAGDEDEGTWRRLRLTPSPVRYIGMPV
jgi:hypothetical protein